jgi:hypothetical protein
MNKNDIIGKRFGKLLVIEFAGYVETGIKEVKRRSIYKCKCDCGNFPIVKRNSLVTGHTKSCGCLDENKGKNLLKHGLKKHTLYGLWLNMKDRCNNPNNSHFKYYGSKNIKVCDEWQSDFVSFYDWAIDNGWEKGLSIERIDINKNYCPENCKWIPLKEQSKNRSMNIYVTIGNETKCIKEWCDNFNLKPSTVYSRIRRGWNEKDWFKIN